MTINSSSGVIVVGVDGTETGDTALRFAYDEARATGASLELVTAWQVDVNLISPAGMIGDLPSLDELEQQAQTLQDDSVARVCGEQPAVSIASRVLRGDAGTLLVDAAKHARLLVVGSRGHGRLMGALLGSVSRHCAHHAECPVVVVPSTTHRATDAAHEPLPVGPQALL